MKIDNEYTFFDIVYLVHDSDQQKRMVTSIIARPGGIVIYQLSCGEEVSDHYGSEISRTKEYK